MSFVTAQKIVYFPAKEKSLRIFCSSMLQRKLSCAAGYVECKNNTFPSLLASVTQVNIVVQSIPTLSLPNDTAITQNYDVVSGVC